YADLNLTESTRPRPQNLTDVQGSVYVEVKIQSLDTNAAASYTLSDPSCHTDTINFKDSIRGKCCCSRTCVAVLVAVITLLLVLAVCLILRLTFSGNQKPSVEHKSLTTTVSEEENQGYFSLDHPTASSPPDSETFSTTYEEALDCPPCWKKNGKKCYFFSEKMEKKDWNASRKECTDMNSDLVVIDDKEEMDYLLSQSRGRYYLLGLTYSTSEKKWKWINNVGYREDTFTGVTYVDYLCAVIGNKTVETAPCYGSSTTQNMCEKAADISE
ncbi:C-type lectin domain family 5 member A-like, partial [Egretta garzetta]|uniref:C-type lectin domain family 5 member A-like n=1 Tax=Egretta garzetta TaxID=188379 RepID=UPI00163D1BD3